MPTLRQITLIHVLKSALHLADEDYRDLLSAYSLPDNTPIKSSKELSFEQASDFITILQKMIDNTPGLQAQLYASPKQRNLIAYLWGRVSRAQDAVGRRKTLAAFLQNKFHVGRVDRLPKRITPRVIKSLRVMNEHKQESEEKQASISV
ncbi:MAG: DUF1018 domain-containing protein [Chitinivibrionales bacterium]|nr:DUF1018 domain-containing protein [Chitinivibrionales bacterium]